MIARRFLIYFLVVSGFAVATTVAFEVYSLERAADQAVAQNARFASSAARLVGGFIEEEAAHLSEFLRELPEVIDELKLRPMLHNLRRDMPDGAGVAVLDDARRILAADLKSGEFLPPRILLPALRESQESGEPVVTDIWAGRNERPHIGLVVGFGKDAQWRTAVVAVPLDGGDFQALFRYFVVNHHSRLQLLDSQGVALFSTLPSERYRSVVHGTYFSDKVRLGEAVAMRCHSCHQSGDQSEPVRQQEITTVAPVPGSAWSVTVRESEDKVFEPMRDIAYSSVALVCVIMGAFVGFYLLLSRRVLKPMQDLVGVAVDIAHGQERANTLELEGRDEFATLVESLETIRRRTQALVAHPPGGEGVEASSGSGFGPVVAAERSGRSSLVLDRKSLDPAIAMVLGGLGNMHATCCSRLFIEGLPDAVWSKSFGLGADASNAEALAEVGRSVSTISYAELAAKGVVVEGCPQTRSFLIEKIQFTESLAGQLWIGVSAAAEDVEPYLGPVVKIIALQIQHLVVRTMLFQQLKEENARKNRMVRHLFEAGDEERRRLAREIHDEPAQVLNALLLSLETFPDDPGAQKEALEKAKGMVERVLDETDRLIKRLRPAMLDDLGLVEAVRSTGENLLGSAGVEFEFGYDGHSAATLSKDVEVAVYRVLQESLTNALRHAEAKRVSVELEIEPDRLRASIEDDGKGMDLSWLEDPAARPRWGLLGMQERIIQFGGKIKFSTPHDGGVRIEFEIPLHGNGGSVEGA